MLHSIATAKSPTLLDDLLEDSARIFHRHCATIQLIFHKQWLKTLGEKVEKLQIENPDANPAVVENRAREVLIGCRIALRVKQSELIQQERTLHAERDHAARAYASFHPTARAA